MGIVRNLRCIYTTSVKALPYKTGQLLRTVKYIAHKTPIDKVAAMVQRHSGKIAECGGDKIIVFTRAHDTRVGIPSGDYRIVEIAIPLRGLAL